VGRRDGLRGEPLATLSKVGAAVEDVLDELGETRQPVCAAVGAIMGNWWERDHASFLREIELEHAPADERHVDADYERMYTPGLLLYNCMPARALRDIFDELGGGVLMSATLEPWTSSPTSPDSPSSKKAARTATRVPSTSGPTG